MSYLGCSPDILSYKRPGAWDATPVYVEESSANRHSTSTHGHYRAGLPHARSQQENQQGSEGPPLTLSSRPVVKAKVLYWLLLIAPNIACLNSSGEKGGQRL